ncbi:MAG: BON domain-containing protein [Actinobacteria bacterium]|nr:BON domain-containing protein [Actinomycetota bacterium]
MSHHKHGTKRNGRKIALTGGAVAAIAYFFDPHLGRTRRAKMQDQLAGMFRRGLREIERKTEYVRGQAEGMRYLGRSDSPPENDATLTAKVESEVLSRWNYPKGQISVNSADGIVELRGTCDSQDQINDLEYEVRKVTGVMDVHNYLHLPNTPAPNKEDVLNRT